MIAHVLVIVGALNWGLIGLGHFMSQDLNVVGMILGSMPELEAIVYVLVGLSGVWMLMKRRGQSRQCSSAKTPFSGRFCVYAMMA